MVSKYSGRRTIAILVGGTAVGWALVALLVDAVWITFQS